MWHHRWREFGGAIVLRAADSTWRAKKSSFDERDGDPSGEVMTTISGNEPSVRLLRMDGDIKECLHIEFVDESFEVVSVAESFFRPRRFATHSTSGWIEGPELFFWLDQKEACLKAMGDGLSSADEIQSAIPAVAEANAVSLSILLDKQITEWSLISLGNEGNYKLALAVEGKLGAIRQREFSIAPEANDSISLRQNRLGDLSLDT